MPSAFTAAQPQGGNADANANAGTGASVYQAAAWRCKIGGKLLAEEAATVMSVTRSLGMRNVDQAMVVLERAASPNPFLGDSQIRPIECGQTLEIISGGSVRFWGVIEDAEFYFGETPDEKRLVASIQPHHFGDPITSAQFLHVKDGKTPGTAPWQVVKIDEPIVFNGWADEERQQAVPGNNVAITGNMSLRQFKPLGADDKPLGVDPPITYETNLFIALDAVQTPGGRTRYVGEYSPMNILSFWTLRDAVRYLCAVGNTRGLIQNPTEADLSVLPRVPLYRTEFKIGVLLTEALDQLLGQYGFYWYVDPNAGAPPTQGGNAFTAVFDAVAAIFQTATAAAKPRIKFVARGLGPEVEATHAKPRQPADFSTTNVKEFRARYSIAPTVNEIVILGGVPQIEVTLELQRVGKNKWAFNEAWEYDQLTSPPYRPADDPDVGSQQAIKPKLEELFPASELYGAMAKQMEIGAVAQRRRPLPMLNLVNSLAGAFSGQADLRPAGVQSGINVEIIDRKQDDTEVPDQDDKEWINVANHPQRHLMKIRFADDELAIYFDDGHSDDTRKTDEFDAFLESLNSDRRVRMTCVIEADRRLQVRVRRRNAKQVPSVQGRPTVFFWDGAARFPFRRILTSGKYKSVAGVTSLTSQTPYADLLLNQMREFGEQLLAGSDQATLSGQIEFQHLDYDVPLGGIVKQIGGRELHLITTDSKDTLRYPQVVALHYEVQDNVLTATLSAEPANLLEAFP